jgi:general secretion pathway protein M
MIVRLRDWYLARTQREQYLLLAMTAIAVPLLVWLLLVRPLSAAYEDALKEHLAAVDRHGRVLALADAIKTAPARPRTQASGADLALVVTEAATQSGISLQGAAPSGPNAVQVTVGGGQATAITQWLRGVEERGLVVEELRLTPLPDGSVNMSARVARLS